MADMIRARGPQRIHVLQRVAENIPVKEADGIERLVLRARRYVMLEG